MPLARIPDSRLEPLVRRHLSIEEDSSTADLIVRLRAAKKRGYVKVSELIAVLRHLARKFQVSARDIERTLFLIHRKYQAGRLYDPAILKG